MAKKVNSSNKVYVGQSRSSKSSRSSRSNQVNKSGSVSNRTNPIRFIFSIFSIILSHPQSSSLLLNACWFTLSILLVSGIAGIPGIPGISGITYPLTLVGLIILCMLSVKGLDRKE